MCHENSRRLEVEKDLKYHKDESKTSVFRITEEGTTYVSDSIKMILQHTSTAR